MAAERRSFDLVGVQARPLGSMKRPFIHQISPRQDDDVLILHGVAQPPGHCSLVQPFTSPEKLAALRPVRKPTCQHICN